MVSNMNVSITLRLNDHLSRTIKAPIVALRELQKVAQDVSKAFNNNSPNGFAKMQGQARALVGDLRGVNQALQRTKSAMAGGTGGNLIGRGQLASMREMLRLQQQMITNQNRLYSMPAGGGGSRGGGLLGRAGFSP